MSGVLRSSAQLHPSAPAPREHPASQWIREQTEAREARDAATRAQLAALDEAERPGREAAARALADARAAVAALPPSLGEQASADIREAMGLPDTPRSRLAQSMRAKSRAMLATRTDANGNPVIT